MDTCLFAQHFWGEKHSGFDAMYQNFKLCYRTTGEFAEFLRESYSIEDTYHRALIKLAKQTGSGNHVSSFKPCWTLLKQLIDQIAQVHLNIALERQNLSKDVQKYQDEQQKRQKSIKESEASTQEVVHAFQVTAVQLQKAKETYHSRYNEYERIVRNESSSNREQEKLEAKLKKAQDEYKYSVEKYNNLRNQFVSKMYTSCAQFQEIEVAHLEQMREFVRRYAFVWSTTRETLEKLYSQFDKNLSELTTDRLLNILVSERGTGTVEPQGVQFEDAEVAAVFSSARADHSVINPGNGDIGERETFIGREGRAASALAVVGAGTKENGELSGNSMMDINADSFSITSISVGVPSSGLGSTNSGTTITKRRDGFFRKRRNSLSQDSAPSTIDSNQAGSSTSFGGTNTNIQTSSNSLSAFTVVAKRGILRLGTPHLNGKDKQSSKVDVKSEKTNTDDWRTATPVELPKDEEGYNIRPSNPWGEDSTTINCSDGEDSESDSELDKDFENKTFQGLKVNIRPVGELAPAVASKDKNPTIQNDQVTSNDPSASKLSMFADNRIRALKVSTANTARNQIPSLSSAESNWSSKNQSLIQSLPVPPALPPPPQNTLDSLSFGSLRSRQSIEPSLFSSNTVDKGHFAFPMRPRGYSSSTWTKKSLSNLEPSQSSKSNEQSGNIDLLSLDPLSPTNFTTENNPNSNVPNSSDNTQLCSSDLETNLDNSEIMNDIESFSSPLSKLDQSISNSQENIFRRCTSAIPTPGRHTGQSNWLVFESDASGDLKQPNSPLASWPSQDAHNAQQTKQQSTVIPEPPARLRDHWISASNDADLNVNLPPSQTISLACAFTETWHARFYNGGGSSFSTAAYTNQPPIQAIDGCLTLAFPRSDVEQKLQNMKNIPTLSLSLINAFRLKNLQPKLPGSFITSLSEVSDVGSIMPKLNSSENFIEYSNLSSSFSDKISQCSSYLLTIPGNVLFDFLCRVNNCAFRTDQTGVNDSLNLSDSNNTSTISLSYIKLDILSYSVEVNSDPNGSYPALTPPIHLCTYWRCEPFSTDFRLDYTAKWPSPISTPQVVKSVGDLRINLTVDGNVIRMQSLPVGSWVPELKRATWRVPLNSTKESDHPNNILRVDSLGGDHRVDASGTVRAKFTLTSGPGRPQPVVLQFFREDSLASGVNLVVSSSDYHLTLCKRRLIGDRYICDPPNIANRTHSNPVLQNQLQKQQQQLSKIRITANHSSLSSDSNKPENLDQADIHMINSISITSLSDDLT